MTGEKRVFQNLGAHGGDMAGEEQFFQKIGGTWVEMAGEKQFFENLGAEAVLTRTCWDCCARASRGHSARPQAPRQTSRTSRRFARTFSTPARTLYRGALRADIQHARKRVVSRIAHLRADIHRARYLIRATLHE